MECRNMRRNLRMVKEASQAEGKVQIFDEKTTISIAWNDSALFRWRAHR